MDPFFQVIYAQMSNSQCHYQLRERSTCWFVTLKATRWQIMKHIQMNECERDGYPTRIPVYFLCHASCLELFKDQVLLPNLIL